MIQDFAMKEKWNREWTRMNANFEGGNEGIRLLIRPQKGKGRRSPLHPCPSVKSVVKILNHESHGKYGFLEGCEADWAQLPGGSSETWNSIHSANPAEPSRLCEGNPDAFQPPVFGHESGKWEGCFGVGSVWSAVGVVVRPGR
jgi:hypothetical protein